ncbi:MAG: twin-arginine translocation signal domain-containing protein [Rhodospirillales bacterium]|nr:twin-arginine translocation signal domain-containing protein [Rhodospirillales bacterium]
MTLIHQSRRTVLKAATAAVAAKASATHARQPPRRKAPALIWR